MPAFHAFDHREMSDRPSRVQAGFNKTTSTGKLIGWSARIGLLIAAIATPLLSNARVAHSGPCTAQIARLERQLRQASSRAITGPTAPQSVEAQLHHQPTPEKIHNAEIEAMAAADIALQRARQADTDGDAAICTNALNVGNKRDVATRIPLGHLMSGEPAIATFSH